MTASFRLIPGHPDSSVIINVPHSSRTIPPDVRAGIMLDDAALERELDAMTDSFTDVIAEEAAALVALRPWIFVNGLSRLVVDPERFPDECEEMNGVGMGAVYTRTSDGFVLRDPAGDEVSGLVTRYYDPHAAALSDLVDQRLAVRDEVTVIDLHSYPLDALPYELHGDGSRPEVCLGTDTFHTPVILLEEARWAFDSFEPGTNTPFSGCFVPQRHYGVEKRVSALMIELRRDLYMDDSFQLVLPALSPIVECVTKLIGAIEPNRFLPAGLLSGYHNCVIVEEAE